MNIIARAMQPVALLLVAALALPLAAQQPSSQIHIPISKDESVRTIVRVDTITRFITDTLRVPGRPDTVVMRQDIVRLDTVYAKNSSCWRSVSLCTVGTPLLLGAGAWAVCHFTSWCRNEQNTRVDVVVNRDRRGGRSLGFLISMPFMRPD